MSTHKTGGNDLEKGANDTTDPENMMRMFFDEEFNPANYIDALFKNQDYSKDSLNKVMNMSNKLTIQLNFLVNQLNTQINHQLTQLNKITSEKTLNSTTRLDYYVKLLNNAIISLDNELNIPEFNQLVVINKLINFKTVKQNMVATLNLLKFIKQNFQLSLGTFEADLMKLFKLILSLDGVAEKHDNLVSLVRFNDMFKNLNHFNSVYKKNVPRFINERNEVEKLLEQSKN